MPRVRSGLALATVAALTLAAPARGGPSPASESAIMTPRPERPAPDQPRPFSGKAVVDRATLVAAVLERNPSLEAVRWAWAAALERIPQRGSLADPTVSYAIAPLSIGSSDVRFGQVARIGQRFPYPGTLRLRTEAARAEAEAAAGRLEALRLRLATAASLLYDDYYVVHRALEINADHEALLEDFRRIATARYAAGLAAQQDPLQAEVEQAHLVHRRVVLETERTVLVAELNALLHRAPGAPLPPPEAVLSLPERPPAEPDSLLREAWAARPELAAQDAELRSREAAVALRRLDFRPGFEATASFNSMWRQEEHRWIVGVGLDLPVFRNRLRAAVAEAEAERDAVASRRESLVDQIATEVTTALARLEEAGHVVELYRSRLLPASRDQVAAARAGFESGRNSFLALIEAERSQRSVELAHHQALADANRARAELDRALGRIGLIATPPGAAAPRTGPQSNEQGDPR